MSEDLATYAAVTTEEEPTITVPMVDVQRAMAVCAELLAWCKRNEHIVRYTGDPSILMSCPCAAVALENLTPFEARWIAAHPESEEE